MGVDLEAARSRLATMRSTHVPLHLSVNVTDDWLEAIEFGSVVDGRPASQLVELTPEQVAVIAARQHVPEMVALEIGSHLCRTSEGERQIEAVVTNDEGRVAPGIGTMTGPP